MPLADAPLLVLGFEPFDTEWRNPSGEIARRLDGERVASLRVLGRVAPVSRAGVAQALAETLARPRLAAVVALGVFAATALVRVERLAVNRDDFRIADAAGAQPRGEPIVPGGPDAILTRAPVDDLVAAIRSAGVPARASDSAGSYLCNHLYYKLLYHLCDRSLHNPGEPGSPAEAPPAVFLHVPSLPEVVASSGSERASMALETSLRATRAALALLAETCGAATAAPGLPGSVGGGKRDEA